MGNLAAASALAGTSSVYGSQCVKVPASGAGSMRPLQKPLLDNDLTQVHPEGPEAAGSGRKRPEAAGQRIVLSGQIMNED